LKKKGLFLIILISSIYFIYSYNISRFNKTTSSERNTENVVIDVLEEGVGSPAEVGSIVKIHYKASLEDGTIFDSSYERNMPFKFKLGTKAVLKGLNESVLGMKKGGKIKVIIPPKLGFKSHTLGGLVPPDSFLFFEIERVE